MAFTNFVGPGTQQSWASTHPWGGGHTLETDPTKRGWRMKAVSTRLCVFGRTGRQGCISVMQLPNGRLDVAIYDERTPEDLFRLFKDGENVSGDLYKTVAGSSGWLLQFILDVERVD